MFSKKPVKENEATKGKMKNHAHALVSACPQGSDGDRLRTARGRVGSIRDRRRVAVVGLARGGVDAGW